MFSSSALVLFSLWKGSHVMTKIIEDHYLGDGVYASFDGYHVVLDLRGQDNTTRIALEPMVQEMLREYIEDVTDKLKEWREKCPHSTIE